MDFSLAPLGFFGVMVGIMLWSLIVKMFYGIVAAARNATLATLFGELTNQKIRKILAFLFVASCAWVFSFAALSIHFMPPNTSGVGLFWFFAGMATTPLFIWATTLRALSRSKQRRAGP